jgi:hypothetical protein
VHQFIPIISLVVVGIIIADIVTHGSQFAQAMGGLQYVENPAIAGLLGQAPH